MLVTKRNGSKVEFEPEKIYRAVIRAAREVYAEDDSLREQMKDVTSQILAETHETDAESITISMVQSIVEQKLIANGYLKIAERYIAYRLQRDIDRYFNADTMMVHLHFEKLR